MVKKRKSYAKKYPMLNNVNWINVELTEEENNERIKRLAQKILFIVERNSTRKSTKENLEQNLEERLKI